MPDHNFGLCSLREDITFRSPTQFEVTPVGKSDSALDYKADFDVGAKADFLKSRIICGMRQQLCALIEHYRYV